MATEQRLVLRSRLTPRLAS